MTDITPTPPPPSSRLPCPAHTDAFSSIWRIEGFRGLYKGTCSDVCRIGLSSEQVASGYMQHFVVYMQATLVSPLNWNEVPYACESRLLCLWSRVARKQRFVSPAENDCPTGRWLSGCRIFLTPTSATSGLSHFLSSRAHVFSPLLGV